jgi:carbamoyl-phosphate synthase large subunit
MKSTGEVMGIDEDFGLAYAKSQMGAGVKVPAAGTVFLSVKDVDKAVLPEIAREFHDLGFQLVATEGTHACLAGAGLPCGLLHKISEGQRPNVVDLMINEEVQLIINTPSGKRPRKDEVNIRTNALARSIPLITTLRAARAFARGIRALQGNALAVQSLQEYEARRSST